MIAVLCFIAGGVAVQAAHWVWNLWEERASGERAELMAGALRRMAKTEESIARCRESGWMSWNDGAGLTQEGEG